jgi:hypothetical protein
MWDVWYLDHNDFVKIEEVMAEDSYGALNYFRDAFELRYNRITKVERKQWY